MVEKRKRQDSEQEPSKSILSATAEIAFPRGGASVLTPLEVKEVANEATQDALFEQSGSNSSKNTTLPPKKKSKKNKVEKIISDESEEKPVSVDSLSFNVLNPGSIVLGKIKQINKMEIILALPDNLDGYIPITNISFELNSRLEEYEDQEEEDNDDPISDLEDSDVEMKDKTLTKVKEFPKLSERFYVGQFLRAAVVENTKLKTKKRIELSIEPEKVNSSIEELEDLISNAVVQASVKSVEDHGAILNFGRDFKLSGFISKKELSGRQIAIGSVLLVSITKSNQRTATCKIPSGNVKKQPIVPTVSSIDAILPGMLIDALITDSTSDGLVCKAYALCDATINFTHLGVYDAEEIKHKFSIGSKIKARVIASYLKNNEKKLQLSILPHLQTLSKSEGNALEAFALGHIFDSVTVKGKDSSFIFVNVGSGEIPGEAHFSRVSEKADLDMDFKIGSTHRARILGYSTFDNIYILTLDKSKINQTFLRAEDIPVGKTVLCEIKKIIADKGIVVKVEDIFEGFVPLNQMSDVRLIYPERKFKIGSKMKARVLKIINNGSKASIIITLKKSLVNVDDDEVVSSYDDLQVGRRVPATIEKILPAGCVLTFFGFVRAFLPNSEISETFVKNPSDHVKLGQTVKVRITSINSEAKKVQASLRVSGELSETQTKAMDMLIPGRSIVNVQIVEKEKNAITVELEGKNLRGIIYSGHLSDGNYEQNRAVLKKLKVGSTIEALVISIDSRSRNVFLSAKPSLITDAKNGTLPTKYKDISVSARTLHGFIKSVIPTGVFVSFGNNLTGLVIPKFASEKRIADLTTAFIPNQSVSCNVITVDDTNKRFLLTLLVDTLNDKEPAVNPIDKSVKVLGEYAPGRVTKGTIKSIKDLQMNIQLADNQEGRIEVSEIYSDFHSIKDSMKPLAPYKVGQILDIKIIGYYDVHKNRFLSVNKNKSKNNILELSIRPEDLSASEPVIPTSIDDLHEGDKVTGYVSSFGRGLIWISISPSLRAKLSLVDLTDDTSKFDGLENNYPIGRALRVNISSIDKKINSVTVSTRENIIKSINDVKVGEILPAKVLKTKESYVLVSLGSNISAVSFITDALDNYSDKVDDVYSTGDVSAAKVLEVDIPNNKIFVSLRSASAKDKLINTVDDIKRGDIVKGFIKNVANQGLFVALGRNVHALVRVSDLSDSFLKDWKQFYKVHQPVTGKIIKADEDGKTLMTLKDSEVNGDLNYLKRFEDLSVGDTFEGSVRRVTDFGVFVKLDGTLNITGLCHRSQIADSPVENLESIFAEGDRVKIKILGVDGAKKQLSLGMKASYFKGADNDEEEIVNDDDIEMGDASGAESDSEDAMVEDAYAKKSDDESGPDESDMENSGDENAELTSGTSDGLSTGFDWTTSVLEQAKEEESSDEEEEFQNEVNNKKKKKKRSKNVEDKTAEINTRAPQSISDFERLLVGNPDSSILWIQYMSFELQLSEINKAREIAERALKSINYREEQEKLNIWIAFLNLENMFGDEESLEEVFKRACQYMDSYTIHQKLVTIYIASENFEKANELYTVMCKKFGSKQLNLWVSYGNFLLDRGNQEEAHKILAKALQVLSKREHVDVVRKFAQLEFSKGDMEQGRSLFEGLLSDVPKRIDLWNVYIDQEIKVGEKKKVEVLFDRVIDKKLTRKQAKFFFGKWLAFEEKEGDEKAADYVKAKAAEYAQRLSDRQ